MNSEMNKTKKRYYYEVSLAVSFSILITAPLYATPKGGNVVAGSVDFDSSQAGSLNIHQHTDKAIIDWQSFGINPNEKVEFIQLNNNSVVLNRVLGADRSIINGHLKANGKVFIVNQNGIVFGKNAQINVGGLVATTSDIANQDFLKGLYRFNKAPVAGAKIINEGNITIADRGLALLVAPSVENRGVINAQLGRIVLGSAKRFTLDLYGDGLIQFDVTDKVEQGQIRNTGTLSANGGTILISAEAARNTVDDVISLGGMVEAKTFGVKNGKIILAGGDNGTVSVNGTLDVSGKKVGQKGGNVQISGKRVNINKGAKIDASGNSGGGKIQIGKLIASTPSQQASSSSSLKNTFVVGKHNLSAELSSSNLSAFTDQIYISKGSTLNVSTVGIGNAGDIMLHSRLTTNIHGNLNASGGKLGRGGKVQITGQKVAVHKGATIDASGSFGGGKIHIGKLSRPNQYQKAVSTKHSVTGDFAVGNHDLSADLANSPVGIFTDQIYIDKGATLTVSALDLGNAGDIILHSSNSTVVHGNLKATGGRLGGSGGFIETSSNKNIQITKAPTVHATVKQVPKNTVNVEQQIPSDTTTAKSDLSTAFEGLGLNANEQAAVVALLGLDSESLALPPKIAGSSEENAVVAMLAPKVESLSGTWLIDPNNIEIVAAGDSNVTNNSPFTTTADTATIGVDTIQTALSTGANVVVTTVDTVGSTEEGNILWTADAADLDYTGTGNSSLSLTAHNDITIGADVEISGGAADSLTLTLTANSDAGAGDLDGDVNVAGNIQLNGGNFIVSGETVTMANGAVVNTGGGVASIIASSGDITVATLNSGTANTTLTATAGGIVDGNGVGTGAANLNVTAANLAASAATSISLDTAIDSTTSSVSGAGGALSLNETDALTVTSATTNNGAITISSGGEQTATLVNSGAQDSNLIATTGDLKVGSVTAANTGLTATTGSITDENAGTVNVTSGVLTATSATGIDLDTTIASTTANVTGTGNIDLNETDALTVTSATTTDGTITIQSGGEQTATLVNSGAQDSNLIATTGDLKVGSVTAANTGLTATTGSITDENAGTVNVTSGVLTATSATGIDLDTTIVSTTMNVTGVGDINISESNSVVATASTSGNIAIFDNGTLQTNAIKSLAGGNINLTANTMLDVNDVITTNGSGNINLTSQSITLGGGNLSADSGDIIIGSSNTLLNNSVTLDLSDTQKVTTVTSNTGNVTFNSTIDGAGQNLLVNNGGLTSFLGSIGTAADLASIETDAQGTVRVAAQTINTTGSQTYNETMVLDDSIALGGNDISFNTNTDNADGGDLTFADVTITNANTPSKTATNNISFNSNGGNIVFGTVDIKDEVRVIVDTSGNTNAGNINFTKITSQDVTDPNAALDDPTVDPDLFDEYVQLLAGDSSNANSAGSITGVVDVYDLKVTGGSGVLTGDIRKSTSDTIGRDAAESIDTDKFLMPSVMTFNGYRITGGPTGSLNEKLFLRFDDKIQAGQNEDLFAGSIKNGVISEFVTIKDARAKGDKWSVLGIGKGFPDPLNTKKEADKDKSVIGVTKKAVDDQALNETFMSKRIILSKAVKSLISVFRG